MVKPNTKELIQQYSHRKQRPDNSHYTSITLADAVKIADESNLSLAEVEQQSFELGILPERYSRNQKTLSLKDQQQLHLSHVAIVGLGGLGGTVTEILARIGIGRLTLIDGDCFDESNLNRQLLSSPDYLGIAKARIAAKRAKELNPAIRVKGIEEFLKPDNGEKLLKGASLAIDCLDTISDRFILEEICHKIEIPFISAAIGGTSGQALVVFPHERSLETIYGKKDKAPRKGVEASMGTLPYTAIHMAAIETAEAINVLLGKTSRLRSSILLTDVADHSHEIVEFQ